MAHFFGFLAQPSISLATFPPPRVLPCPNQPTDRVRWRVGQTNEPDGIDSLSDAALPPSPLASRRSMADIYREGREGRTFLVWPMLLKYILFPSMLLLKLQSAGPSRKCFRLGPRILAGRRKQIRYSSRYVVPLFSKMCPKSVQNVYK